MGRMRLGLRFRVLFYSLQPPLSVLFAFPIQFLKLFLSLTPGALSQASLSEIHSRLYPKPEKYWVAVKELELSYHHLFTQ